jgi:hypothetical protein
MVSFIQTEIYEKLPNDGDNGLKANIKSVNITSGCGKQTIDGIDNNGLLAFTIPANMFIPSSKEIGIYSTQNAYPKEGTQFDFFNENSVSLRMKFIELSNINSSWWLRSAFFGTKESFSTQTRFGSSMLCDPNSQNYIVLCFVIG